MLVTDWKIDRFKMAARLIQWYGSRWRRRKRPVAAEEVENLVDEGPALKREAVVFGGIGFLRGILPAGARISRPGP